MTLAFATPWLAVPLALCTAASTMAGGLVALRYRRYLGTVIAFSGGGAGIALSTHALGAVLAVYVGFFLFLGASDLLPEAHHEHPPGCASPSPWAGSSSSS